MAAYYNEIDPYAAQWLRNLIAAGLIAPGDVDERSIEDVHPDDLKAYTQCHFFAGIGAWSLALRRAGWPDDRPIWTGSCPCQPFSSAGAQAGFDDERHLWPAFHWLIQERRPGVVAGEQVASKDAEPWLDLVQADLEALGYAFGAVPFPAAGIGAPNIRDRLYWVADMHGDGRHQGRGGKPAAWNDGAERDGRSDRLGDTRGAGLEERIGLTGMARGATAAHEGEALERAGIHPGAGRAGPVNGLWRDADWLFCRDGKWRPVSPKPQPLVDGTSESLGRVRAEIIAEIEEEINAWSMESKIDRDAALRSLLERLGAQAKQCWATGRLPGLHEAPFLLAFLRQLKEQGWRVAECLPLSCEEIAQRMLRGMRNNKESAGAPCEHRLEGQSPGERADSLSVLSSLLARHASAAWGDAYAAHAEIGFPLAIGARSRVGRLRAYGNAINAEAAKEFIAAYMETM